MTRRRDGFTVTELVVVVVILLLAALLFPVFAQIRAGVRQSVCASPLRRIAQAGLLYLANYDERFPSRGEQGCRRRGAAAPVVGS